MRHLLIAIIAAASKVVFAPVASAADMPVKAQPRVSAPPPVYNWTGFYVGGHVGYLWGRTNVEEEGVVIEDGAVEWSAVRSLVTIGSTTNSFLASKVISAGPTRTVRAPLPHPLS